LQIRRWWLVGILIDACLHDGDWQRGVAPGQELAAIHRDRRDPTQTLRPGSRLLVVGEARREGQRRHSSVPGWLKRAPAIVLSGRARATGVFARRQRSL